MDDDVNVDAPPPTPAPDESPLKWSPRYDEATTGGRAPLRLPPSLAPLSLKRAAEVRAASLAALIFNDGAGDPRGIPTGGSGGVPRSPLTWLIQCNASLLKEPSQDCHEARKEREVNCPQFDMRQAGAQISRMKILESK
jgi:hypothetical protein